MNACAPLPYLTPADSDDFKIRNIANVQQVREATVQTQALLLAVISLIVGGIGIMHHDSVGNGANEEIGLRMAVGGRGRDILLQFLIQALAVASAGGVIGGRPRNRNFLCRFDSGALANSGYGVLDFPWLCICRLHWRGLWILSGAASRCP